MGDITRYRGDTKSLFVSVRDAKDNPVPTTSTELILSINSEENPVNTDNEVMRKTAISADASLAKYEISFEASDVDFVGSNYYDIQFKDSTGKIATLDKGSWTMLQDITK